jgi:glycosyltransferase involved in cell wall biosynthesis
VNVLHVIPAVAARDGGPTVAIREMTAALAREGARVTVAATDADGPRDRLHVPLETPVMVGDVAYRHFARSVPGEWKLSIPLARWLYRHAGDFDVVHVHALFSFATIPGSRAPARAGVPFILRPLGTLDPWSLRQRRWKKAPYLALIERRHLREAAAIHVTSQSEAAAIAQLGFGAKARVIPLGVPVVPATRRAPVAGGTRLLFLSRLHPKKNIPLLLEAMHDARAGGIPLELVIAGGGPDAYRGELESRARSLGIASHVRFVGHVEGEEKSKLFADADVFVLPSSQENFGIAVAEALAAGVPVIASDQVAIAGEVADAGAGWVVPVSRDALTAALREASADPTRRTAMGHRAEAFARERYSWARTARDLMALYRELAR